MTKQQAKDLSNEILTSILPAARSAAVLFCFTRNLLEKPHTSVEQNGVVYAIFTQALPNEYARIDIVCVNGRPIGSVLFVEIASSMLHMVGMFIKEEYRGQKISYVHNKKEKVASIASFILDHVMEDLTVKNVIVTLEVMNYNVSAYKLYERTTVNLRDSNESYTFQLCSKGELLEYIKIRRKTIKRWHDIGYESDKLGVQWSHVPDYNGETTWSITRVYSWKPSKRPLSAMPNAFIMNKLKLTYSILRYGNLFRFMLERVVHKNKA